MIKTKIGGYSASEPPPPSTSSTPYLENIAIGSSVCGGGRFIRGLAFFFGDVEVEVKGEGPPGCLYQLKVLEQFQLCWLLEVVMGWLYFQVSCYPVSCKFE